MPSTVVSARLVAAALCAALSTWPALASAEETPTPRVVEDCPEPARDAAATQAPQTPKAEPTSVPRLPPTGDGSDIAPASYWTTDHVAGWSLLGAAAASTGLAIYFDHERREAREAQEELLNASDPSPNTGDQAAQLDDEYRRAQIGLVTASALTAVFAVVGGFLVLPDASEAARNTTAQVAVDPTGMRIDVSGRF